VLDENIWLSSVAAAEDCPCVFVKEPDLVIFFLRASSEIGTITVIEQRKNTTANGNARSTRVTSFLPCCAKGANLGSLLDVERLSGFIEFEG
jgi:hypothetical protein